MNKQVKICIFDKDTTKDVVILSNGNAILDNICTYCKTHENLDGTYEIDAEFIVDSEGLYKFINDEAILKVQLDYGDEYFRIINTRKTRNSIVVYGRQITIYESMHLWLSNVRPTSLNGIGALNWMLEGATGVKELEVFSDISNSNTSYFIDMNMYQALHDSDNSFQNRWGGEVLRRGYLLSILTRVGIDRGVQIRSRKNLTGFEYETNTELVTRIKPKGFDGITIQGFIDSPLIDNYARIYTKEIKYEDVKVKGEEDEEGFDTLAEAQAELTRLAQLEYSNNKVDIIQANYNISFIDLSTTEEYKNYIQAERVYIGDTVHVYEDKFDCNIQVRAIDRIYNVLTQRVEEITLSNKDISTKSSINDTLIDIVKGIENNDNSIAKWIQSFIQSGIKDSYVFYNKAELVVCDSANIDDAIHVWRFNKNGLAHSSTGYQGPYDVAITADGKINASMILGGLLKGQYIDAKNLVVRDDNDNVTIAISNDGLISIVQGLIEITKDGIKINLVDSENNILGYVLYDAQGVQVFDSENNNPIAYFTREGSYIENLQAEDIECNSLVKVINEDTDIWYVASESSGDGSGRDTDNKACSLQEVINNIKSLGMYLTNDLTIEVESGDIKEDILLQNIYGASLFIKLKKGVSLECENITIKNCLAKIVIEGETDNTLATDDSITSTEINNRAIIKATSDLFTIDNSKVDIKGIRLRGSGIGCLATIKDSKVKISDSDISNFTDIFNSSDLSICTIDDSRGNVDKIATVDEGAIFTSTSKIPNCTTVATAEGSGIYHSQSSYTKLSSLYQETTTGGGNTNTASSFTLTNLHTTVEGSGSGTAAKKGMVGQGKYGSYKAHRGHATIPALDIIAAMNARENPSLQLEITRLATAHGYAGAVPHPILRTVGNGANQTSNYWDSGVTFARGDKKTINLDASIVNGIRAGATELQFWAESNQATQYSFYNKLAIKVVGNLKNNSSGGSSGGDGSSTTGEVIATARVLVANLNVRTGPGTSYSYVGLVTQNQIVEIVAVDSTTGWYKIIYNSGYGWISNKSSYTEIISGSV